MNARCALCECGQFEVYCPGLLRCRNCALVFADADLTDQQLLDLYGRQYFFGAEYGDYLADRPVHRRNFELRLRVLERFLDPVRHRSLFEIGSAYGFFLDLVRTTFERVEGIDISRDAVQFAREQLALEVDQGEFLTRDFGERAFDVVCMWDVLEHLRTPHTYLAKIAAHSAPGALIALTTGDVESLNARMRRGKWRLIHPPTHLHYFSRRTIVRLLEKYGYEVIYNRHCGVHRSLNNIAWTVLASKGRAPAVYTALKKTGILERSVYLNFFDIRYVIGRKKGNVETPRLQGAGSIGLEPG